MRRRCRRSAPRTWPAAAWCCSRSEAVDAWLEAGLAAATPPPRILEVGLSEAQKSFVMAGFGWSIVSGIAVAREVQQGLMRALPLSPPLSRPLAMAWRRDRVMNPAIRVMRGILRGERRPVAPRASS
ncbi:MAG: hypothetical protein HYW28_02530 [Rhodospirillales bacterium]|nr:hypothetical protein [Rhodospirillales bacterium]